MPALRAKESDVDDLKELLPLAARACGLRIVDLSPPRKGLFVVDAGNPASRPRRWNPLTPGDGAEMEDKLRISVVRTGNGFVCAESAGVSKVHYEQYADHPDEGTARRWASLRVAAEIGRSMK
jgi:hypothetical protein